MPGDLLLSEIHDLSNTDIRKSFYMPHADIRVRLTRRAESMLAKVKSGDLDEIQARELVVTQEEFNWLMGEAGNATKPVEQIMFHGLPVRLARPRPCPHCGQPMPEAS